MQTTISYCWFCCFMQSATRVGIPLAGSINYQLEPITSAHACASQSSCAPTFRTCAELYNSWPGNYIEIYAWYQLRSIRWCRARIPWGGSFVSNNVTINDHKYNCKLPWNSSHLLLLCRVTHVDLDGVLGVVWVLSRLAGIWVVADDTNCGDSAIRGHKLGQMTWAAHKNLFHL